jgi:antitoxin (DNA-binding transcriptional repressor) of toxin-antitoxin stability system
MPAETPRRIKVIQLTTIWANSLQAGEEIVIARAGKPVARLTPIVATESRSGVRYGGINYKKLKLSGDFHAPLTDDDLLNT